MSLHSLYKAKTTSRDGEDGFTLIELLVVVVILGILIAIAIPTYLSYRKSANDKSAQSDLRNAVSTFEVCNSDVGYPTAVTAAGVMTGCDSQKNLSLSSGTQLRYEGTVASYVVYSTNTGGTTNKTYCYSSVNGGSVKTASGAMATATCPA